MVMTKILKWFVTEISGTQFMIEFQLSVTKNGGTISVGHDGL